MKIKNEQISIKIGKKQYDFKNLILNKYLERCTLRQLEPNNYNLTKCNFKLATLLIKFDDELEINENSEILNSEFDICFSNSYNSYTQTISKNQIVISYDYSIVDNDSYTVIYDYNKKTGSGNTLSDYYGKRITALGFNSTSSSTSNEGICAVLDLSNYDIYIQENQDLNVRRIDTITTDALFYSSDDRIKGPVHLAPYGMERIIKQPNLYNEDKTSWYSFDNVKAYAFLYSIGLSSYINYIDKEYIIYDDIDIVNNGTELVFEGIEEYLAENNSIYSGNLYSNSDLYPIKTNYKYIILKYKVWQPIYSGTFDNHTATITDMNLYYHQAIPIDKFGKMNFKIKYERG